MSTENLIIYLLLAIAASISYRTKKLTFAGAITGAIVGACIYKGSGPTGLILLAVFFVAGTLATKWQVAKKTAIGTAEHNNGQRTAGQVLANGGVAAALGLMGWLSPEKPSVALIMIAGSLAAAMADTLSSELGMIYGRRFFNILTFKKDTCGLDGVISLEGTLIGVVGAMMIAGVYCIGFGWGTTFYWISLAGVVGNLSDSILGALLERQGLIGNNLVNFLNTLIGAMVCYFLPIL